jgi:hypothetical protein
MSDGSVPMTTTSIRESSAVVLGSRVRVRDRRASMSTRSSPGPRSMPRRGASRWTHPSAVRCSDAGWVSRCRSRPLAASVI